MVEKLQPTNLQWINAEKMLVYQHAYLWGDPGTGKTLTSIIAIAMGCYDRCVVVGPVSSLGMWGETFAIQLDWNALVIRKGKLSKRDRADLEDGKYQAIVTSYSIASNKEIRLILQDFLEHGKQTVLIIDESHYCKSPTAQRTQTLLLRPKPDRVRDLRRLGLPNKVVTPGNGALGKGIGCYADDVWQLTGTPITRWPDDLYAQLVFGREETLKAFGINSYNDFIRKFCVMGEMRVTPTRKITITVGSKNDEELNELLRCCMVIRCSLAEAAAELPPVTHRSVEVEVHGIAEVRIGDKELLAELTNKDSFYAKEWHKLGEQKAKGAIEYITEVANREPVLVGFWHRDVGQAMYDALKKDFKVELINGSVDPVKRDLVRDDFNAGKVDIIVGQMAAMNTSWNLQECGAYVIIVEQLPSPGAVEQFWKRVYRKGQQRHVQVDHICAAHTLDKALIRIREEKTVTTNHVMKDL